MSKTAKQEQINEEIGGTHELETLRNLIYGNQARASEKRVGNLERRVEAIYGELGETIRAKTQAVAGTANEQVAQLRQDLLVRGDAQTADLNKRLDAITADFTNRLQSLEETLLARINRLQAETTERLLTLQEDSQARDDGLRQELLTLTAWLDDQKTSRYALGDLLIGLGEQLRVKHEDASSDEA